MKMNSTKEIIVNSLIELMKSKNLIDIFVKDIAKMSNITRQTFYRHFKDKYDVINWYYDRNVESLFSQTQSIEGIRKNLMTKCNLYKKHIHFFRKAYHCSAQNSLADHEFQRIYDSISDKIRINTGIDKNSQTQKLKYSIEFFSYGVVHMTIDWLNRSCPTSCETYTDILIELIPEEVKSKLKEFD